MSLAISFPAIGLGQFLRTPVANYQAHPVIQVQHWITDSLMALPLFALGVWAADLIARRMKVGTAKQSDLLKRSILSALLSGLALAPAWFAINKSENPTRAQPLVFPYAHDSGDVYSVAPGVIVALVCACLVPAAFWAGRAVASAIIRAAPTSPAAAVTRAAVPAMLAAAVAALAWLLYQTAEHAYATQVYYARAPLAGASRARLGPGPSTASGSSSVPHLTPAPDAFISQSAHALQDGLVGQAAGFPAAAATAIALLRVKTAKPYGKPVHTDMAG